MKQVVCALLGLAGTLAAQNGERFQFQGEYRVRAEDTINSGFVDGNSDGYLLGRLRLTLTVTPIEWAKFQVQAQDSQAWFHRGPGPSLQNRLDLRIAFAEFGDAEKKGWSVRAGRQSFWFGEGRLVGDPAWSNTGRTFDAVRSTFHHGRFRADIFASSVVRLRDPAFDRFTDGDNFHGAYGNVDKVFFGPLESYVYWRVGPIADFWTYGIRWPGKLPQGWDATLEMVRQEGRTAREPLSAWAGHWVIGRTFDHIPAKPRIFGEHNYASGDSDATDRRRGTFDQLYPAAHDRLGFIDQVGWRNARHWRAGVELRPLKGMVVQSSVHGLWLADPHDGLYAANGSLVVRRPDGTAGTHIGWEYDLQGVYSPNKRVSFGAGLGFLRPGEFLRNTIPNTATYVFPHVMASYFF